MGKLNCWQFKGCGREGKAAYVCGEGICPATTCTEFNGINGGVNGGRVCWFVAGTLCNGEVRGTYAKECGSCIYCDFYRLVKDELHSDLCAAQGSVR